MKQQKMIHAIVAEVRKRLDGEGTGHDWWHVWRVWQMARRISKVEAPRPSAPEHGSVRGRHARGINFFVVELAALLHDIADWKFHGGDDAIGSKEARKILQYYGVHETIIVHVCDIVDRVTYKGAGVSTKQKTIEGKVVQDADRLDAIGAIGIARTFAYGGYKHRMIYDPKRKPILHASKKSYFNNTSATINHFYEKLLLLTDRMNTRTAKKIARERHKFMQEYLKRFFKEWNGKL